MSKISIRHTLQAAFSAALIGIPLLMGYVKNYPKLSGVSAFLGLCLALITDPRIVLFLKSICNLFLPEAPQAAQPTVEQKKDGGFIVPSKLIFLLLATLAVLFVTLVPKLARAQEATQSYGGCLAPASYGILCVGPRAGVLLTRYDFSGPLEGKFTGGFGPGAGYGIILQSADPSQSWKRLELDVFLAVLIGGSGTTVPNSVSVTGLLTFFDYISLGVGSQWTEQPTGSAKAGIFGTAGFTINIGGMTPAQTRKAKAAMARELEAAAPAK